MHSNHNLIGLCGAIALALLLAHPAGAQVTLLSDNFNSEHGGTALLNYNSFANFNAVGGTVDLLGKGLYDLYPGNGLYVDLDGTTHQAATFQSKTNFNLTAGTYTLQFTLGGSQRKDINQVNVLLGGVYSETFVRAPGDPLAIVARTITVGADTTGFLSFHNLGGDNSGAILDNVSLVRAVAVPEPGSVALFVGIGMAGAGFLARRRRSARKAV